ncbi:hypothetical protein HELRODRAFT_170968 [Helobdella robusta]|uniref:Arrestin C-terminal-like domain-containing protein n=1 Tax=Helobdella robusta TaxID=6412 RepID=T1F3N0_HELRO|nr:hypothetical protein HELRODRAFT_170968 [Helobdella robusta]ESO06933.1 hypothetical protein HELRODRAFT_170968 [Helobdella robusta]
MTFAFVAQIIRYLTFRRLNFTTQNLPSHEIMRRKKRKGSQLTVRLRGTVAATNKPSKIIIVHNRRKKNSNKNSTDDDDEDDDDDEVITSCEYSRGKKWSKVRHRTDTVVDESLELFINGDDDDDDDDDDNNNDDDNDNIRHDGDDDNDEKEDSLGNVIRTGAADNLRVHLPDVIDHVTEYKPHANQQRARNKQELHRLKYNKQKTTKNITADTDTNNHNNNKNTNNTTNETTTQLTYLKKQKSNSLLLLAADSKEQLIVKSISFIVLRVLDLKYVPLAQNEVYLTREKILNTENNNYRICCSNSKSSSSSKSSNSGNKSSSCSSCSCCCAIFRACFRFLNNCLCFHSFCCANRKNGSSKIGKKQRHRKKFQQHGNNNINDSNSKHYCYNNNSNSKICTDFLKNNISQLELLSIKSGDGSHKNGADTTTTATSATTTATNTIDDKSHKSAKCPSTHETTSAQTTSSKTNISSDSSSSTCVMKNNNDNKINYNNPNYSNTKNHNNLNNDNNETILIADKIENSRTVDKIMPQQKINKSIKNKQQQQQQHQHQQNEKFVCSLQLEKTGFVPGEDVNVTAGVENLSYKYIRSTYVALKQIVRLRWNFPRKSKVSSRDAKQFLCQKYTKDVFRVSGGVLNPGDTAYYHDIVHIPPLPPTHLSSSAILANVTDVNIISGEGTGSGCYGVRGTGCYGGIDGDCVGGGRGGGESAVGDLEGIGGEKQIVEISYAVTGKTNTAVFLVPIGLFLGEKGGKKIELKAGPNLNFKCPTVGIMYKDKSNFEIRQPITIGTSPLTDIQSPWATLVPSYSRYSHSSGEIEDYTEDDMNNGKTNHVYKYYKVLFQGKVT